MGGWRGSHSPKTPSLRCVPKKPNVASVPWAPFSEHPRSHPRPWRAGYAVLSRLAPAQPPCCVFAGTSRPCGAPRREPGGHLPQASCRAPGPGSCSACSWHLSCSLTISSNRSPLQAAWASLAESGQLQPSLPGTQHFKPAPGRQGDPASMTTVDRGTHRGRTAGGPRELHRLLLGRRWPFLQPLPSASLNAKAKCSSYPGHLAQPPVQLPLAPRG